LFFFFQAEDGIRDFHVTGVQTCALPISIRSSRRWSTASMCCSASGGCTRTTALSASSARREEHMAITNTTVSQTYPRFQSLVYPTVTPHAKTLTTAGGAQTLTAAELLGGLLLSNCDDAQTLTLPSATDRT